MTTQHNAAKIQNAADTFADGELEAMLLREEQQGTQRTYGEWDDDVMARDDAERAATAATEAAAFFDKDIFRDEHRVPSVSEIYTTTTVNAGKPNERDDVKFSTDKLADWLEDDSAEYFMATNQGTEPFIYRNGCYVDGVKGYLRTMLHVANRSKGITATHINEVMYRVGSMSIVDGSKIDSEWSDITILNNCVLNTNTGEITPHSPEHYTFSKLACDYDADATCPTWQEFLDYALPDKAEQTTLQEMFGATLKRNYNDQAAFFMLGKGGNGKGVVMNVLRAMLGAGATSAVPLQQVNNRFFNTDLYGRYANISGDTSPAALVDSSMYKMLTGDDPIRAEYKGKDPFDFKNHATIINSMNELMPTTDQTDGFFRRFVLIRFDVKPTEERKQEKNGFVQKIRDNELPGVLNWAIKGLKRLNAQGGFTFQKGKNEADLRKIWNVEANHVEAFVGECCVVGASTKQYVATDVFMAAYRRWHEDKYDVPPKEQQSDITKAAPWAGFVKPSAARVRAADAGLWLHDDGREKTVINAYKGIYLKNTSGFSDVDIGYVAEHWSEITGLAPAEPVQQPPEQLVELGDMVDDMRAALDKAFMRAADRGIDNVSIREVFEAHPKGLSKDVIRDMLDKDADKLGIQKVNGLYYRSSATLWRQTRQTTDS